MTDRVFLRRSRIEAPAEDVFRWHTRPGAFERLNPPWSPAEIVSRTGGLGEEGSRVSLRVGPFGTRWVAEHRDYRDGRSFRDVQVRGPFARWEHLHLVEPDGPSACRLEDRVLYALPGGAAADLVAGRAFERMLARVFAYRHRVTAADVAVHAACRERALKVAVTGSRGLIGAALVPFLGAGGHPVVRLVRREPGGPAEVQWDPAAGRLDARALEGVEAVVHLAGEGIAEGRWTPDRKRRIRDSRVQATRLLAETLAGLERKPEVLVCASAVGWYGDRGDEVLTEASAPGQGFLSEVCREWEAASEPAARAGIRVVHLRLGIVLSPSGGALAKMLLPFRLGAGGPIGSGRQHLSWIALDDVLGALHHALLSRALRGPVNAVAPEPSTNAGLARALARALSRPALAPLPAFAARLAFGEMADALLLASTRVVPERLLGSGYGFLQPDLEPALRHMLGKAV